MKNNIIVLSIAFIGILFYVHSTLAVWNGSISSTVKISDGTINGPVLADEDRYGVSIENIGDLNGDGVQDLAVGANRADDEGFNYGVIYIHFMNVDGSIDSTVKINDSTPNGPTLADDDRYGVSIENIGDLNGDGVQDLAVGALFDDGIGVRQGSMYIHFMNTDASIKSTVEINGSTPNGPILTDDNRYGTESANIGDLNGDGVQDLMVGANGDNTTGLARGAAYIHFMNIDGSVDSTIKINELTPNGPNLIDRSRYGISMTNMGDLNGDGVQDLAVGAFTDSSNGNYRGAVYIHFMNTDGSIKSTEKINGSTLNGPTLSDDDQYGRAVSSIGDLDGDGVQDLAVNSLKDDSSGLDYGAVYIHFMNTDGSIKSTEKINGSTINGAALSSADKYGISIANIGDLNGDGIQDLAFGANVDDTGGVDRGAIYIHYLAAQASIAYDGNFAETVVNDGSVTGFRTSTVSNDTFINAGGTLIETTHFTLTNKPSGLTTVMNVNGDGTIATLTLTGEATNHADVNDMSDLAITFLDGVFTNTPIASNVINYTDASGVVDFNDKVSIVDGDVDSDENESREIKRPREVTLQCSDEGIALLEWSDRSTGENNVVIQRSANYGHWEEVKKIHSQNREDWIDEELVAGGTYSYRIRSQGGNDVSEWSDEVNCTMKLTEYAVTVENMLMSKIKAGSKDLKVISSESNVVIKDLDGDTLAFRSGPGTEYDTIATFTEGTELIFLDTSEDGNWYHVRTKNGTEGWIGINYAKRIESRQIDRQIYDQTSKQIDELTTNTISISEQASQKSKTFSFWWWILIVVGGIVSVFTVRRFVRTGE